MVSNLSIAKLNMPALARLDPEIEVVAEVAAFSFMQKFMNISKFTLWEVLQLRYTNQSKSV